jgi:hypothetical protein
MSANHVQMAARVVQMSANPVQMAARGVQMSANPVQMAARERGLRHPGPSAFAPPRESREWQPRRRVAEQDVAAQVVAQ